MADDMAESITAGVTAVAAAMREYPNPTAIFIRGQYREPADD